LKWLSNFTMDLPTLDAIVRNVELRPGEELIGAYRNSHTAIAAVVVTSLGLRIIDGDGSRHVPFTSIARVDGPSEKDDLAPQLVLSLAEGGEIGVPIRGGRGQFKDVFEFQRFLARVLEDQSGSPEL
jgi:hypothetical protein